MIRLPGVGGVYQKDWIRGLRVDGHEGRNRPGRTDMIRRLWQVTVGRMYDVKRRGDCVEGLLMYKKVMDECREGGMVGRRKDQRT